MDKAIQQKEIARDFLSYVDANLISSYFLQAIWSTHPKILFFLLKLVPALQSST